jgi:hypothetical protein
MSIEKAKRIHRMFHGKPATKATPIRFEDPEVLIVLGRAVAIEYETDKINGAPASVAGKKATYRHKFGSGVLVCMDQTKKKLVILGGKLRVESRGIVN